MRYQFKTLLQNWYTGVRGKFRVPVIAERELDLWHVFWALVGKEGENLSKKLRVRPNLSGFHVKVTVRSPVRMSL